MTAYKVEVQRVIVCTVEVEAGSPEDALHKVDMREFILPDMDDWEVTGGYRYEVIDDPDEESSE